MAFLLDPKIETAVERFSQKAAFDLVKSFFNFARVLRNTKIETKGNASRYSVIDAISRLATKYSLSNLDRSNEEASWGHTGEFWFSEQGAVVYHYYIKIDISDITDKELKTALPKQLVAVLEDINIHAVQAEIERQLKDNLRLRLEGKK